MSDTYFSNVVIKLDGPVNIRTVTGFHAEALAALTDAGSVVLDIAGNPEVDLSFVQLVKSARLYAKSRGRELTLSEPASGSLLDVLKRGGFIDAAMPEDEMFWLHKGSVQ